MTDKYLAGGSAAGLYCGFGAAARWRLAGGSSAQEPAGGGGPTIGLTVGAYFGKYVLMHCLPVGPAGWRGHKKLPNVGYS